ncbi:MAG: HEAT repeat domain-containing protein [Phycisphaerales bacterium]|nr:HEAT repeat domain-containing protein [Phycisphaerales bacterium]
MRLPRRRVSLIHTCMLMGMALGAVPTLAQDDDAGFVTGRATVGYSQWTTALQAVLARDLETADVAFDQLLALNPTPMRLGLFEQQTKRDGQLSGALLLLEQDAEAEALGAAAAKAFDLLKTGREQLNEADDGFYFARIGRFDVANANLRALLDGGVDPVALLEFTDRDRRRSVTLGQLADHPIIGATAREMLDVLRMGEQRIKADPTRIKQNIQRLDGPPRGFENGLLALQDSGEFAIPFLLEALRDPERKSLHRPIIKALPLIDHPGLNPLTQALQAADPALQIAVADALGRVGYWQAVPYLLAAAVRDDVSPQARDAMVSAVREISSSDAVSVSKQSAARAFYTLAEQYYDDAEALRADSRQRMANVWYWKDNLLLNVEVPTAIFNDVMAMRCCEEAQILDPELKEAIALWLAANFRREAELPPGETDNTRPENYPSALYFAQSAGPEYCLMALARAVDKSDAAVALGAIEALRQTGGAASVTAITGGRQPLGEALLFPDRMVRIRSALAIAAAQPTQAFRNQQSLMPVLSEAIRLHGGARNVLVIDADNDAANATAAALREVGYTVAQDAGLFNGLEKARKDLPGLDAIFIASDSKNPTPADALAHIRREPVFTGVPVVLVVKPGDAAMASKLAAGDYRTDAMPQGATAEQVVAVVEAVSKSAGATMVSEELGAQTALETAAALVNIGESAPQLGSVSETEPALLAALKTGSDEIRKGVAGALAYVGSAAAQEAVAEIAFNAEEATEMRLAMFAALADSAKRNGAKLGPKSVETLIEIAKSEADLTLRLGASQALGAMNLAGDPAGAIIRDQHEG